MKHLHEHQEVIFSSLLVSTHTYSDEMFWATSVKLRITIHQDNTHLYP